MTRRPLLPLLLCAALSGCAATVVGAHLDDAATALRHAEQEGAATGPTYEYVMAQRYLEKAREEKAQGELAAADLLARRSVVWSERAVTFLDRQARRRKVEDLPDDEQLEDE